MSVDPPPHPEDGPLREPVWPRPMASSDNTGATAPSPRGPQPAMGPPQPARSRRTLWIVLIVVGVVLSLLVCGCAVGGVVLFLRLQDRSDSAGAGAPAAKVAWEIGNCVHQVGGPTAIPSDAPPDVRQVQEARQQWEAIGCADPRAVSRIEALGAKREPFSRPREFEDDGCPPNTDKALIVNGILGAGGQVVCLRFLESPHPGDPGGGGGKLLPEDCVGVIFLRSRGSVAGLAYELPCSAPFYFAQIIAVVDDEAACPADVTLSRLETVEKKGQVVCLGQGEDGTIAKPGDCVQGRVFPDVPTPRLDCDGPGDRFRVSGFADAAGKCPRGGKPLRSTGYDRPLCGKFE